MVLMIISAVLSGTAVLSLVGVPLLRGLIISAGFTVITMTVGASIGAAVAALGGSPTQGAIWAMLLAPIVIILNRRVLRRAGALLARR